MSRSYLDENGNACFICAPNATSYVAQVRLPGHQKWRSLGEFPQEKGAAQAMFNAFAVSSQFKRGRVMALYEHYDPSVCMEITR